MYINIRVCERKGTEDDRKATKKKKEGTRKGPETFPASARSRCSAASQRSGPFKLEGFKTE